MRVIFDEDVLSPPLNQKQTIVVCIGTNAIIGDALGPLVGTMLQKTNIGCKILGTLNEPIHAKNYPKISNDYNIIAIDSRIAHSDKYFIGDVVITNKIGDILITSRPITPRFGQLNKIDQISILGTVLVSPNRDEEFIHLALKNTRLNIIYEMAEEITENVRDLLSILSIL